MVIAIANPDKPDQELLDSIIVGPVRVFDNVVVDDATFDGIKLSRSEGDIFERLANGEDV
jgi:hypothetical protein